MTTTIQRIPSLGRLSLSRGNSQHGSSAHGANAALLLLQQAAGSTASPRTLVLQPAAAARQASSQAGAAVSADTSYVLDSSLRGDRQAASSFLLSAVRRVHAAATKRQL